MIFCITINFKFTSFFLTDDRGIAKISNRDISFNNISDRITNNAIKPSYSYDLLTIYCTGSMSPELKTYERFSLTVGRTAKKSTQ